MRVCDDVPPLRRGKLRRIIVAAFVAARFGTAGFRVCHYSIQNNHLHLLCEATNAERLARGMQGLAVRLAKRLNRATRRRGTFWKERYHERILRTPREVRNALVYVLQNGRHHPMGPGSGAVPESCLDVCSSAPYFDGWKERLRFAPAIDPPASAARTDDASNDMLDCPVATPGTWLLSTGWRRHGLVSVNEGPAS